MEKKYFLFGGNICNIFLEEGIEKALKVAKIEGFALYCWDENSTPLDLLEQFVGWSDFTDLTESEYNEFKLL